MEALDPVGRVTFGSGDPAGSRGHLQAEVIEMRRTKLLSWIGLALGAAYLVAFGAWAVFGSDLEFLILGAPFYVVPLVVVALVLRSSNSLWRSLAGIFALLGAVYFFLSGVVGIVGGGWQQLGPFAISVPAVAYCVVVFWTTVLHRTEHKAPMTSTSS